MCLGHFRKLNNILRYGLSLYCSLFSFGFCLFLRLFHMFVHCLFCLGLFLRSFFRRSLFLCLNFRSSLFFRCNLLYRFFRSSLFSYFLFSNDFFISTHFSDFPLVFLHFRFSFLVRRLNGHLLYNFFHSLLRVSLPCRSYFLSFFAHGAFPPFFFYELLLFKVYSAIIFLIL